MPRQVAGCLLHSQLEDFLPDRCGHRTVTVDNIFMGDIIATIQQACFTPVPVRADYKEGALQEQGSGFYPTQGAGAFSPAWQGCT